MCNGLQFVNVKGKTINCSSNKSGDEKLNSFCDTLRFHIFIRRRMVPAWVLSRERYCHARFMVPVPMSLNPAVHT